MNVFQNEICGFRQHCPKPDSQYKELYEIPDSDSPVKVIKTKACIYQGMDQLNYQKKVQLMFARKKNIQLQKKFWQMS